MKIGERYEVVKAEELGIPESFNGQIGTVIDMADIPIHCDAGLLSFEGSIQPCVFYEYNIEDGDVKKVD